MARQVKIRMDADRARRFVELASHCDFDVDVASCQSMGYVVDGKSVLGVLGLDMSNPMIVSFDGENADLEALLSELQVQ